MEQKPVTRQRIRQRELQAAGICIRCGVFAPSDPTREYLCQRCKDAHRVVMARRRLKLRLERGKGAIGRTRCTICGFPGHTQKSHDMALNYPDLYPAGAAVVAPPSSGNAWSDVDE